MVTADEQLEAVAGGGEPPAPRVLYLYAQVLRAQSLHARRTFQVLALMKRAGLEVELLTLPGGDPWPTGLVERVYRAGYLPFARHLPLYGHGPLRVWATVLMTLSAVRLYLTRAYAAIHCADRTIRVGAFVAWLFRSRFVFEWRTESGFSLEQWAKRRSARFLKSVCLVLSDVPVGVAQLRRSRLCGRVAYLPTLPAPWARPLPLPAVRLGGTAQVFTLVAFSAQTQLEDLSPLVEALPEAFRQTEALRVQIYGGTARARERLGAALGAALPRTANIQLQPLPAPGAAMEQALAAADAVFFPAQSGPEPLPWVLDAMASRRAVIAIRCPAMEALAGAKVLLVAGKSRAIAEAIEQVMGAPFWCVERAWAAEEWVRQERSSETFAETLRGCYAFALRRAGKA